MSSHQAALSTNQGKGASGAPSPPLSHLFPSEIFKKLSIWQVPLPRMTLDGNDERQATHHNRFREKKEQLQGLQGFLPESQGQDLALAALYVTLSIF
jgi:hypothetical protein